MNKLELEILNFEYNGFYGKLIGGEAEYTAEFKEWTNDPGVGVFICSDGKERLIPTFAIKPLETVKSLPKQSYEHGMLLFGAPSKS